MAVTTLKSHLLGIALLTGAILPTGKIAAQASAGKRLLLKEAVSNAMANNASLKVSGLEAQIAKSNYRQTDAILLPHVELGYTAMATNNPLNAFGFKLQQENVTAADFDPTHLNNPGNTKDFSAKVEVMQPLINVDTYFQRAAARKQKELYQYKHKRTQEFVQFDVTKAYLTLQLANRSVSVLEESWQNAKRIEANTRRYFEQGLIKKSDLLNVQVNVATVESYLTKAKSNVSNASEALALTMGEPASAIYNVDSLQLESETASVATEVSPARSDLMALQKASEASSMKVKAAQMSCYPKLNAFGSYQLNDYKMDRFNANSYMVGLKVSWTIFNGLNNYHKINSSKAELEKVNTQLRQQTDQSQLELNKAHRDRMDLLAEINRQNVSVTQAEESLRILQDRYNEGLVSTTDLLMAHSQLLQQKLSLAQSIYGNNLTLAYLEFLGAK